MDLNDFRKDFLESVRASASAEENFAESAFVEYASAQLEEMEELSDTGIAYFRGTGTKRRALAVDAYSFDGVDDSARLILAEWRGQEALETITQTDAATSFGRLRAFVEEALGGRLHTQLEDSSPQAALAMELFNRRTSIPRFRFYLITDCALSTRVRDWPEGQIAGIPAEYHIWDIGRFHRVHESKTGRDELEVDFTEFDKKGISCLSASVDSADYRAYLCVISGKTLAEIYNRYGSRLLEGNVRSFLSVKGKVNKGIRNTILNEPAMFFAYNNGIAATASEIEVAGSGASARITKAKDLQIVNGGQTTASLANSLRAEGAGLEHIFVQMKLSVVSPDKSEQVIPQISRYANSQNKVSDADFFSNHPFHRRIEEISRRVYAPAVGGAQHETYWFYERARGQYLNEQSNLKGAKKMIFVKQHPKDQLITKTDMAKFENAWRGLPHQVSMGAQKNFMRFAEWIGSRWESSELDFNDDYFFRSVAKAILYRTTEKLVSAQSWYEGGYRANIVAYTVAKLADLIENNGQRKLFDLRGVWQKQSVSAALEAQLMVIAEKVFGVIVSPEGGFQNVTEWCKKELCWERVRALEIPLLPKLCAELIDREENRAILKGAKKQRVVDNGIAAQTAVLNLGGGYWNSLQAWAKTKALLNAEQDRLVSVAAQMPRKIPQDFQCEALLEIKAAMEQEGYPVRQ